jgi:4-alpha-glucanotransferase
VQPVRSSGILLHPTSLPSQTLGRDARRFVDWLALAGQSWWQVLPLGPPDDTGSPYASTSAFAGSAQLLERPTARVRRSEALDYRDGNAYWIEEWIRFAGEGALEDQVRFDREWGELRLYAFERGVRIIGDMPIYVAEGGADERAHPELFQQREVAGAPPDALGPFGQLWGNPLYDWTAMRRDGYRWWIERFRRAFELVDLTRIDHFRGFVSYWAVRRGLKTARNGRWRRGPGRALFDAAEAELGPLPVIAEDLGVITPVVTALRKQLGYPGMVVLHWAFDGARANPHRLENHQEDSVVYTGTHDTTTAAGWWGALSPAQRRATRLDPAEPHWSLIELAYSSPARLALVPAQDVLGLGGEHRMNSPGTASGNWAWKLEPGALTRRHAQRLRALAEESGRLVS